MLKKAEKPQLEEAITALYKAMPKDQKQLFEIRLQAALEGKELPGRDAIIPDPKKLTKVCNQLENDYWRSSIEYGCIAPSMKRRMSANAKILGEAIQKVPLQADCFDEVVRITKGTFELFDAIDKSDIYHTLWIFEKAKTNRTDFFLLIVHRMLQNGITQKSLADACLFALCVLDAHTTQDMLLYQRFLAQFKVGDVRMELLDLLEGWLTNLKSSPLKGAKSGRLFNAIILYWLLAREEISEQDARNFLMQHADADIQNKASRVTAEGLRILRQMEKEQNFVPDDIEDEFTLIDL